MATRTEGGAPSSLPLLSPSCSVYRYTDKEIHRPLVRLEELAPHALDKKGQVEKKEAQRLTKELGAQFKNLLGWMGVKKATYPEALAEEWLRYGVANEGHRCELYAQLKASRDPISHTPHSPYTGASCTPS